MHCNYTSDEYNFTYTAILLPFLFHMSIIASRSSSESISGDSIAIFIKLDRLESLRQFLRRVLINFIWEKLLSTDAVETGRVRLMVASVLKFGNMAFNISFEANCFNWSFMFLGGCLAINRRNVFYSVLISGEINATLVVSLPCIVSADLSTP